MKTDELTQTLAAQCRILSRVLLHQRNRERFCRLHQHFSERISSHAGLNEFADAYAQMAAYGLLLARTQADGRHIPLNNAGHFLYGSFPLLRELMGFLTKYGNDVTSAGEGILSVVNSMDVNSLHEDEDFLYFYEHFLGHYDGKMRRSRGVYYTPPPVVRFIGRSTEWLLKSRFGIADGFADDGKVSVLDFAAGTGVFLLDVCRRILAGARRPESDLREHILNNIHGFEILPAPYAAAHLNLSRFLADRGLALGPAEQLSIHLTNTLETLPPPQDGTSMMDLESAKANSIKRRDMFVIIGNPPYAGHSMNQGEDALNSINAYKEIGGMPLGERNLKWLNNDYVKFIRFAERKMEESDEGIVAVITSNSWLDSPTFRGMRHSLMHTFQQIHVLDLHGNSRKMERCPDGGTDQNVFDIREGVGIAFFIRKKGMKPGILHAEMWGSRTDKYRQLDRLQFEDIDWKPLDVRGSPYLFIPKNWELWNVYKQGWEIRKIFGSNSVAIVTARDNLTIQPTRERLMETVRDFLMTDAETAREKYRLGKDVRHWNVSDAQTDIRENSCAESRAQRILYRPFDVRWTYYTGKSRGFLSSPRHEVMRHMLRKNIALGVVRQVKGGDAWQHCLVANTIAESAFISNRTGEIAYIFPLYLHERNLVSAGDRQENFTPEFREWIDRRYIRPYSSEMLLGYIYAALNAPSYRSRFSGFLMGDFPCIPFPDERICFERIAALGYHLITAHLLSLIRCGVRQGTGSRLVEKPAYNPETMQLHINRERFFSPVRKEVWDYTIGSYRVLEQYLKARRGKELDIAETGTLADIISALDTTVMVVGRIEDIWQKAFP